MHRYMLDTNIVIYVIKRRPIEMLNKFNAQLGRMVISSITLAELYYGAEKSQFPNRNLRVVEDFVSRLDVLSYDARAAFHYGAIRADLERKGTPDRGERSAYRRACAQRGPDICAVSWKRSTPTSPLSVPFTAWATSGKWIRVS
ncbi:tRNA(fMet)-specific endonuclease VapC|nr:tRNA(fMet)-specific endonuclease VapC [Candidatus Pantoea persica]